MEEKRVIISKEELLNLLREGKTSKKDFVLVESVILDPETNEYVSTGATEQIDFIEVR